MSDRGKPLTIVRALLGVALALLPSPAPAGGTGSPYLDDKGLEKLVFGTSVQSKTLGVFGETASPPRLARRWVRVASPPRVNTKGRFTLDLKITLPPGVEAGLPGDPDLPVDVQLLQSPGIAWKGIEVEGAKVMASVPGGTRWGTEGSFTVRVEGEQVGVLPHRLAARVRLVGFWQGQAVPYPPDEVSTYFGRNAAVQPMLDGGHGWLEVAVLPATGTVVLPDHGRAYTGATWTVALPAGPQRILALKQGHAVAEAQAEVLAGTTMRTRVRVP